MAHGETALYRVISTIYTSPDGDTVRTYGIEAVIGRQVIELPDLDSSAAAVEGLLSCLREVTVEAMHLSDIAEDFVQRRGMV